MDEGSGSGHHAYPFKYDMFTGVGCRKGRNNNNKIYYFEYLHFLLEYCFYSKGLGGSLFSGTEPELLVDLVGVEVGVEVEGPAPVCCEIGS